MPAAEPLTWSLTEAARALRERRISSRELTQAVIARAKQVNARLNCLVRVDEESALGEAEHCDEELAAGRIRGPLHGVPLAHKDMFYRAGQVSTCGSRIRKDAIAEATATALVRLDRAGAIQFATLHMAEFAFGPTGHNYHIGHCRNAWNPDYITGGSSSGSATSVAARANFAALGSDTGGSIRLPAGFCGITGIKPTYGRVSRFGAMPLSYSLDTVGPLARTVADCAAMLQVCAGADPADPTSSDAAVPDYAAALAQPVAGLRIGLPKRYFYENLDPQVEASMRESLRQFASLGARIVEVELPDLDALNASAIMVLAAEAASIHRPWLARRASDYSDQVRSRLEQGLAIPATQYIDALRARAVALAEFNAAVFSRADVLHAPVLSSTTPTIAETDLGGTPALNKMLGHVTRMVRPFNYLGLPVLALPCGFSANGLPIGMQLAGRAFDETTLFALGHAYQQATDWHRRLPAI